LLAIAVCQISIFQLTHRNREQARSHRLTIFCLWDWAGFRLYQLARDCGMSDKYFSTDTP
ncbi:hypothetical protein, partial [Pseudomonas kitaguniensis]|uniref:hypothetical protein n=1 Tax=Pseudomonas kitaguniensis TaxID=2607908 RepID=UPI003BA1FDF5